MRRHWKTLALLAVLTPASSLPAATIFTDRAAFEAAAPGLPTEDFESGTVDVGAAASFPQPLSAFSDNGVFSPGDVIDGFSLSYVGIGPQSLILAGPGTLGATTRQLATSAFDADVFIALNPGVSAFGVDLLPVNGASDQWTVTTFGAGGEIDSTVLPAGGFYGVMSDEPIFNVVLDQPATNGFIDNLTFGEPIPEPATVGLLALAGLLVRTRRPS